MWINKEIPMLDATTLLALISNRIPAVRIDSFASDPEIKSLATALLAHAGRSQSIEQVTRLGISQYEQGLNVSKENYFSLARQFDKEFSGIFSFSFSPVERMIHILRECTFDADIMSESGFGDYFAGTGKMRNGYSPIHADFAAQDSLGWEIVNAHTQLAWNLYLQIPDEGGELLLWDKLWEPEDDIHQVSHSYYYDEAVVRDTEMMRAKVTQGQVLLINSRNFHAVSESNDRLAFGSFISVFEKNQLRLWS